MLVKVFASGTNVQRLAKGAGRADGVIYTAYSQLEKTEDSIIKRKFYMTEVGTLKEEVEKLDEVVQPNWTKIWKRPAANKAFIGSLFAALAGENTERPELNLSEITNDDVSVFMVLVSADNDPMKKVGKIVRDYCENHVVVVLNGDITTNRQAKDLTDQAINKARLDKKHGVIIIANQMGSRSYSVPEIQATVIAYDRGSVDATVQKVSRSLTPGQTFDNESKEFGHIVDLSFDPNRSDNVERLIIDEAVSLHRSGEVETFEQGVKYFLSSANLMKVNGYGIAVEVSESDLFAVMGNNENLLRVADITVDTIGVLESGLFDLLTEVNTGSKISDAQKDIIGEHSQTSVTEGGSESTHSLTDKEKKDLETILNNAIRALNMSATSVFFLARGGESYRDCLTLISQVDEFKELFGVYPLQVIELLDEGILNEPILDVIVQNSKKSVDNIGFLV